MKDLFVDTSAAQRFCNPVNEFYKPLLEWLNTEGHLVYNQRLLTEIGRGNQNLSLLIDKLIRTGRATKISNKDLQNFKFRKNVSFVSNGQDRDHIKTVVLSARKMAIALDNNLRADINKLPKYNKIQPLAYDCPSQCPYR